MRQAQSDRGLMAMGHRALDRDGPAGDTWYRWAKAPSPVFINSDEVSSIIICDALETAVMQW